MTQETTISDAEIARLERARAVAKREALREALREAVEILDELKRRIAENNPGRKKGSVSQIGEFAADAVQRGADAIWAKREGIKVP